MCGILFAVRTCHAAAGLAATASTEGLLLGASWAAAAESRSPTAAAAATAAGATVGATAAAEGEEPTARESGWVLDGGDDRGDLPATTSTAQPPALWPRLAALVARRGPDASQHRAWSVPPPLPPSPTSPPPPQPQQQHQPHLHCRLFASVLHLRGPAVHPQPVAYADDSQLCFNGELYAAPSFPVPSGASDIALLAAALHRDVPDTAVHEGAEDRGGGEVVVDPVVRRLLGTLSAVRGEWAFLFHHAPSRRVFFGRDRLGRRSLLWHWPAPVAAAEANGGGDGAVAPEDAGSFWVSSVACAVDLPALSPPPPSDEGGEEDAMAEGGGGGGRPFWSEVPTDGVYALDLAAWSRSAVFSPEFITMYPWESSATPRAGAAQLISPLVTTLVRTLPGPTDLLPAPANPSTATLTLPPLPADPTHALHAALASFESLLAEAVRLRVETTPTPPISTASTPPTVAILFSGGLDCTVLAALADRALPPDTAIDLLNVAFENPRANAAAASAQQKQRRRRPESAAAAAGARDLYAVPDRKTGRLGAKELAVRCPRRVWRFVEIDVPYEEAVAERERVLGLTVPAESVMDLSIAIAFWFAARGRGTAVSPATGARTPHYTTPSRVLLSGLGADEQLGGYSRHRAKFQSIRGDGEGADAAATAAAWERLLDELQLDVSRIGARNLGRDDRVVSDLGREVRFPYLAEPVVTFLSGLPVHLKTDPRHPRGVGDKLLLRLLADRLGLARAAVEAKRAVQFGARTAKMESARETGDMVAVPRPSDEAPPVSYAVTLALALLLLASPCINSSKPLPVTVLMWDYSADVSSGSSSTWSDLGKPTALVLCDYAQGAFQWVGPSSGLRGNSLKLGSWRTHPP
ncbi:asparagine synthase-domain-containing protein [Zopfochytrium polystomum]|nr:asparagine synthase-domain-containing protein [Zopfochytrium polystomum]